MILFILDMNIILESFYDKRRGPSDPTTFSQVSSTGLQPARQSRITDRNLTGDFLAAASPKIDDLKDNHFMWTRAPIFCPTTNLHPGSGTELWDSWRSDLRPPSLQGEDEGITGLKPVRSRSFTNPSPSLPAPLETTPSCRLWVLLKCWWQ